MSIIEAKKDYLFNKMIKISNKYRKYDTLKRQKNEKFVENSEELLNIGNEIFDNFDLKKFNIKLFADVCSAPGMYSKIILDNFDKTTGIGISLPVEEGGIAFDLIDTRYKIFYKNILDKNYHLELSDPLKLDLGLASCVTYTNDPKNAHFLNIELIIKSLMLILPNLKREGNLIINLTIKNIDLAFNIINILSKMFSSYKLWKSSTLDATKNTFYFFGYDFKDNYDSKILSDLIIKIKNNNDKINNEFIGDNNEYNMIYKQMKNIYIIRIKAWEQLSK